MDILKMSKNENLKEFLKNAHFATICEHNGVNFGLIILIDYDNFVSIFCRR
jgi:hypothetical protein